MDTMSLHSILCSYGDVVELDYKFDRQAIDELKSIKDWLPSPNGKTAINLTGPIEDLGLDTPAEIKHQRNQPYNENLQNCPSIKDFFDKWTELARCRAATMNKGSFFRLHRDAFRLNDQFRIFILETKHHKSNFILLL